MSLPNVDADGRRADAARGRLTGSQVDPVRPGVAALGKAGAWPLRTAVVLGGGAAAVALAGLCGQYLRHVHGVQNSFGFIFQFAPNEEGNLATWYASSLLLACAALMGATAWRSAGQRYARHWAGLALLLTAMSADETAQAHEMLIRPLRDLWNLSGVLHYAWVIPGGLLVLCVLAACAGFLRSLPPRTRRLLATAAAVYFGGALGVEMVGGYYASLWSSKGYAYALLTCLEESMEMAGAVLLAYGLVDHLCRMPRVPEEVEPSENGA